jgi:PTS system galactitol-specific IIA component
MIVIDESLICIDLDCSTAEEVISHMGKLMQEQGYVKESYVRAVVDREKVFPTGLPGVGLSIAIPHTNPEHVIKPTVAIAIPKRPIKFTMMGSTDEVLECSIIMPLAIKNPDMQIQLLKEMMSVIQNEELLKKIKAATDKEEIKKLFMEHEIA